VFESGGNKKGRKKPEKQAPTNKKHTYQKDNDD
jgi:hypothetical protein